MKPIRRTLGNGMTGIVVPQKGAASMTLMVFVRVGSRYESQDINGASHFIEHLMFKGTKRRPDTLNISKELDRYGAEYNAFTSKDMTAYYIKMDAAHTALAADMLHDMLFHSKYDPKEIERERGVILEEINMYEDNPRMHIEDLVEESLFRGSTLGWSIAGPRDVIRTVPREKLIAYRDAYYIPERMCVAVAGKIVPDVWKLLEKTFGSVPSPKARKDADFARFATPSRMNDSVRYQDKNTEQVQLALSFHGLALEDKRLPAAHLLSTILGGTMSSRLFIQVRERRGLCYSINASHQAMEDTGVFQVLTGLDKTRIKEAIGVIWDELLGVTKKVVGVEELRRAKDHLRGKTTLAFEDSSFFADWYGRQWLFQKKQDSPEQRLKRIEAVSASDIKHLASSIFQKEHMAAAVIGPLGTKKHVDDLFGF